MNLLTHHLEHPSPTFLRQRARAEARMGVGTRLVKFFMDDAPAIGYGEYDALIAENERLRRSVAAARLALARAFGDESA